MSKRSKYVEAWRERAGHSPLVVDLESKVSLEEHALDSHLDATERHDAGTTDGNGGGLIDPGTLADDTGPAAFAEFSAGVPDLPTSLMATATPAPSERVRHCSKCGGTDHNARSCKADVDKLTEAELERLTTPNGR